MIRFDLHETNSPLALRVGGWRLIVGDFIEPTWGGRKKKRGYQGSLGTSLWGRNCQPISVDISASTSTVEIGGGDVCWAPPFGAAVVVL